MSFSNGPTIVTNGLVLALDAGDRNSYVSGSSTWFDLVGSNNGTLTNGPTFDTGSGGSIIFDGVDDYINCGNLGTIGNSQTVEVWFRSTSVVNYRNVLDMNYSTYSPVTGNVGPRLEQYTGGDLRWIWSGNTTVNGLFNRSAAGITVVANTWYQAVFTLSSGAYVVYLNGIQRDSGTSAQGYITTYGSVNLGRGFVLASDRYFTGNESMLRIYNKTLSADEVLQNYNAQKSKFGL